MGHSAVKTLGFISNSSIFLSINHYTSHIPQIRLSLDYGSHNRGELIVDCIRKRAIWLINYSYFHVMLGQTFIFNTPSNCSRKANTELKDLSSFHCSTQWHRTTNFFLIFVTGTSRLCNFLPSDAPPSRPNPQSIKFRIN